MDVIGKRRRARQPHASPAGASPASTERVVHPESVAALLDVTFKLLADEGQRESSIQTRAVAVVGFSAVVVGLLINQAKSALDPRLPTAWRVTTLALFSLAVLVLAGVVGFTMLRVLLPRERPAISIKEIERYPTWAAIGRAPEHEQGRVMRGLILNLAETRLVSDSRAKALRKAYYALTVGLALTSALALTLGLRYVGIVELR